MLESARRVIMSRHVRKSRHARAQHVLLARSAGEPETYLVNDTADPLQRSLTSLELSDVLIGAPPPGASATFAPPAGPPRRLGPAELASPAGEGTWGVCTGQHQLKTVMRARVCACAEHSHVATHGWVGARSACGRRVAGKIKAVMH